MMLTNNDGTTTTTATKSSDAMTAKAHDVPVGTDTTAAVRRPEDESGNQHQHQHHADNDNKHDDDYTFLKDMLHSLPPMKRDELENIVNQTSQWLVSLPKSVVNGEGDGDTEAPSQSLVWNEHVIDPFWKEYQSRTCHCSATETPQPVSPPPSSIKQQQQEQQQQQQYLPHLRKQLQDYQTSQYGEKQNCTAQYEISTSVQTTDTDTTDVFMVRTHVECIDTANFCTAAWHVDWTIQIVNDITAILSGTLHVHTHYYENNINSQMQCQLELVNKHTISLQEEKVNSLVAQFEKNTLSYA
jgi:F-actin capping protein alpha subunit